MSIFRTAIDKRAEEAITLNPAIQTGYSVKTEDVVNQALENPFFLSFNGMSGVDSNKLRYLDSIKTGESVAIKDTNGVSRDEIVFCNPKFTNPKLVGDASGKSPTQGDATGAKITTVDLMFSGTNNQLPTVVGMQAIITRVSNRTQTTNQDAASNTSLADGNIPVRVEQVQPGVFEAGAAGGMFGPIGGPLFLPNIIDEEGKVKSKSDKTERGPYANPIRTGTTKFGNTELSQIAVPSLAGGLQF